VRTSLLAGVASVMLAFPAVAAEAPQGPFSMPVVVTIIVLTT